MNTGPAGKESVFISGLNANISEADIKGEPIFLANI